MISLKRLLKLFFAILLVHVSLQTLLAQVPIKLRSTLGASGSSKTFAFEGKQYYLVHSMGQLSVIGLSQNNKYLLRQGFIQPLNSAITVFPLEILLGTVYPNPFSANITVSFAEDVSGILHVTFIDMNGKISYLKTVAAAKEIKLNVESLAPSVYILKVHSTTKCFSSKMIKL
ncbi:MAG: T9SS type A sorting domain-containing protein [Bacteroidales bacterium]|nr:T9SS type A sorting domain-containing protein [Bacteroidales bacterium]